MTTQGNGAAAPAALNIRQRLRAVKEELPSIGKEGQYAENGGGRYSFVKWEDVAAHIGPLMAKHGIDPEASITKHTLEEVGKTRNGNVVWRAVVNLTYSFINVDDPEDRKAVTWVGVAHDSSDKAVQKAATSATKNVLMKQFNISGGDDVDPEGVVPPEVLAAERPSRRNEPPSLPAHNPQSQALALRVIDVLQEHPNRGRILYQNNAKIGAGGLPAWVGALPYRELAALAAACDIDLDTVLPNTTPPSPEPEAQPVTASSAPAPSPEPALSLGDS